MSQQETSHAEIAERYASVLLECAQEQKGLPKVLRDAKRLQACLDKEERGWTFLASPVVLLTDQARVVERLVKDLKLDKLVAQFLRVVLHHHRLPSLPFILKAFLEKGKALTGAVEGVIETPTPLSPQTVKAFQKIAERYTGKEVALKPTLNQALLGGVVMRVGTFMIDASLKTRLNKLRKVMKG